MNKTREPQINRLHEVETYDEPEGCDGMEVFSVTGLAAIFTERPDLPEANRLIVDPRFAVNEGWYVLYWRGGRYVMEKSQKKEGIEMKEGPGYVGVVIGWYREEGEKKASIAVGGYRVEAEQEDSGLLLLTVNGASQNRAIMVDHPASGTGNTGECLAFTDNQAIVAYELDCEVTPDSRINPKRLRRAAKDPAFLAWWKLNNKEDPVQYADQIEEMRRRDAAAKKAGPKKTEAAASGTRSRN